MGLTWEASTTIISWSSKLEEHEKNDREESRTEEECACASCRHERMLPQPSLEIVLICARQRKVAVALCLHAYMVRMGLQEHTSLGNHLVSSLAQVGLLCIAYYVFERLALRSEFSWNILIQSFLDHGDPALAFSLYQRMCSAAVCPQAHTYIALLQFCGKLKDLQTGCTIHAHIAETGLLKKDLFLGSTLIDMYGKCGSLGSAQEVFDNLTFRNTITWNTLISGYVQHEHGAQALHYFEQMQCHGVSPDVVTFTCILKACSSIGAIEKGNEIYAEIDEKGLLQTNPFIGSALVDMYAKYGFLAKAQEIFEKLPVHNVVTWTALIAGYVQHECGDEALSCFEQMQIQGVSPNAVTYACILKACNRTGLLDKGIKIHSDFARKQQLNMDISVGNALVDMYARCGSLTKAQEVFDMLPFKNLVTWNTLLTGHVQHEHGAEVLQLFEEMRLQGVLPDAITISCVLRACGYLQDIDTGSKLHAEFSKTGLLDTDISVGNALVNMYAKCGSFAKAQKVFDMLPTHNLMTWNSLIMGFVQHEHSQEGLKCFEKMQLHGVLPDAATYACILRACGSIGASDMGKHIHEEVFEKGLLETDAFVGSALVDMYAKLGLLSKAQEVFNMLPIRDVVTWTALIAGYAQLEKGEEALKCLDNMKSRGVPPNAHTYACSLRACGSIGALDKGREIHDEINQNESLKRDATVGSALVDMYAKCGWLAKAQDTFDTLLIRNKVTWNSLITGYAQLGEPPKVLCLFDRMTTEGISPDQTTFLSVLTACSHAGFVDEGYSCLQAMAEDYSITSTLGHHTCMIDLLGRAGQLEGALVFLRQTPFISDVAMWLALLGSCRKWGDVEMGRQAFKQAVQLNAKEAASYICMLNIYVDAAMQEDALG